MVPDLQTPRLLLRPWRESDADTALAIYSRWEVARYLGASPRVWEGLDDVHAAFARWASFEGPRFGVWAIVPHEVGRPVGSALLKLLPYSSGETSADVEVGWHLDPAVWGRGYATEAGGRLLDHAWEAGIEEVYAVTYPANVASRAVCRRLGMTDLGQTDRYYGITCELFRAARPD